MQGKNLVETAERRILPEKDGKFKNLLKRTYLTRWVGGSDGSDADDHHMDFARLLNILKYNKNCYFLLLL